MNKYCVIHTSKGLKSVPAGSVFSQQDVWCEGSYEECELYIRSTYDWSNEEMLEPDPRDQSYVDDFGDHTT